MSNVALIFNLIGRDAVTPATTKAGKAFNTLGKTAALAVAGIGAASLYAAGNFQQAMTRIETGAGEAHAAIASDSQGVLRMMSEVGVGAKGLTEALYFVNSAGYHGAAGLNVLKVSAQGAKVGVAEIPTVVDAVTTALNAFHLKASDATDVMNALIGAETYGKMSLEDLAGSLSSVAPAAAVAGVKLHEVLAAMSVMTAQGTPAANAATYLRQVIGQLSSPTAKAAKQMEALGLNSTKVAWTVGNKGLAAAIQMLYNAIAKKMGPGGLVYLDKLKKMNAESSDFQKILANLPPSAQTALGALANMTGGVKSMQAVLQLGGKNMATFQKDIAGINNKVEENKGQVEGWKAIQGNFNQKMAEAKASIEATSIRLGTMLLPKATATAKAIGSLVGWFSRHKAASQALGTALVALGAVWAMYFTYVKIMAAVKAIKLMAVAVKGWTVVQWAMNTSLYGCPVIWIIGAVLLLVGVIILIATKTRWFQTAWNATWGFIKGVGLAIGHWFAGPFAGFFVNLWNKVVGAFTATVNWFKALPGRIVAFLRALPGMLWSLFTGALQRAAYAVGFGIGYIIGFTIKLPGRIVSALAKLGSMLWNAMTAAWRWGLKASTTAATWLWTQAKALPGRIVRGVASLGSMLWNWAKSAWTSAYRAGANAGTAILNWAKALPGRIWGFLKGLPGKMLSLGKSIVTGLINGIKNAAGKLWDLAKSMAKSFLSGFKKALHISSPSKVMFDVAVTGIGAGLLKGLAAVNPAVGAAGAGLATAAATGAGRPVAAPINRPGGGGRSTIEFKGQREIVEFLRKLVKDVGNGSVDVAFGSH